MELEQIEKKLNEIGVVERTEYVGILRKRNITEAEKVVQEIDPEAEIADLGDRYIVFFSSEKQFKEGVKKLRPYLKRNRDGTLRYYVLFNVNGFPIRLSDNKYDYWDGYLVDRKIKQKIGRVLRKMGYSR